MKEYIWLFPLLFILHDMEEIIGLKTWLKENKKILDNRFPKISKAFDNYSTEGMAIAVYEELVLCVIICIISIIVNFYALWVGAFIAYTLHLVMHIIQTIVLRKYVPALATSIIILPVAVYLIAKSIITLNYSLGYVVLYSIIGTIVIALNLKFTHILMHKYKNMIDKQI